MKPGTSDYSLRRQWPKCEDMRRLSAAWLAAFFFTGSTSLILAVIWMRLVALSAGATPVTTAAVVGASMGGMAVGSWIAGRRLTTADPIRAFAWTQAWIGGYALVSPALIAFAAAAPPPRGLVLAAVTLLPVTAAMGASLPCLVRALDRDVASLATTVGRLYAVATAGAVLGPLLAVFVLFPSLGLYRSLVTTAVVNLSIGGWVLAVRGRSALPNDDAEQEATSRRGPGLNPTLAVAVAISGAMALMAGLAWSRALAVVYGSSVHGVALMLSTYLFGIAVGSAGATAGLQRSGGRAGMMPIAWLLVASSGAAFASLFVGERLPFVFLDLLRAGFETRAGVVAAQLITASLLMLPATMCLGAMLPVAVAATGPSDGMRTRVVSYLYAATLMGAAAGTALACWMLVAGAGVDVVVRLGVFAALAVAVAIVVRQPRLRLATMAVAALAGVVVVTVDSRGGGRLALYYRDGPTATVAVHQVDRYRLLTINGRTEASNGIGDVETHTLVAHLAILAAGAPRRVAVIGWRSGMTAAAALSHPVTTVDAFEIDPVVVEASAYFDEMTGGPLDDPRLHLRLGDARRLLRAQHESYDVIIAQPSSFTLEFFELAASRLTADGVMGQWLHLGGMSEASVRSAVATFREVFPHTLIFEGRGLILLGARQPIRFSLQAMTQRFRSPAVAASLAHTFVTYPADLLVKLRLDEPGVAQVAAEAPLNTNDNMRLELAASESLYVDDVEAIQRVLSRHPASPLSAMSGYETEASALIELAASSFTGGRDEAALAYCEQALALEPSFAGLKLLGQIEQRRGHIDRARAAWESALRTGGDQAGRRFVYALLDSL